MPLNARVFQKALSRKGFRLDRRTTDNLYYLWVDDRKTRVFTKASMGRSEELGESFVSKIKNQMRLDKAQLRSFVDCAMGFTDYVNVLREKRVIE